MERNYFNNQSNINYELLKKYNEIIDNDETITNNFDIPKIFR